MPEQPVSSPTPQKAEKAGPPWSAVLQIAVAILVGTALVAGPQVWAFSARLRDDWRRWSTGHWAKTERPAPKAAVRAPVRPAIRPLRVAAPIVKASPPQKPARRTQARVTGPRPTKVKPQASTRSGITAQILLDTRIPIKDQYDAHLRKGIELYQSGWYGPAVGRFRRAAGITPTATAYLWIGRSAIRAGRHDEARIALERAIALAPESAAAKEANALLDRLKVENNPS
jgi:tetratricopeptide (TPR) repeat protein